jgi:hypothetical protein
MVVRHRGRAQTHQRRSLSHGEPSLPGDLATGDTEVELGGLTGRNFLKRGPVQTLWAAQAEAGPPKRFSSLPGGLRHIHRNRLQHRKILQRGPAPPCSLFVMSLMTPLPGKSHKNRIYRLARAWCSRVNVSLTLVKTKALSPKSNGASQRWIARWWFGQTNTRLVRASSPPRLSQRT